MCDSGINLVTVTMNSWQYDGNFFGSSTSSSFAIDQQFENRKCPSSGTNGLAVSVRNLFVSSEMRKPILSNLCMNVRKGTIYTLLGDSGCGKSTLLNTVVGLKPFDSGDVFVLNKRVSGTPGNSVGFMPQDIALYDQLSIKEMIKYYGKINGMSGKEIDLQVEWLIQFLKLPSKFQLIKNLSGGMRRRCSLAVTLIHRPTLIILDEPTVGLDPLLRETIWEYLQKMAYSEGRTIIVTTHYLEEAKYADTMGVMRKGRIIAEDSPQSLLVKFDSQHLQQVIVKLCHADETNLKSSQNGLLNLNKTAILQGSTSNQKYLPLRICKGNRSTLKNQNVNGLHRILAFSTVIWLTFIRHPVFLTMVMFLPTIQMLLSNSVIGTEPRGLKFGAVNYDSNDCFQREQKLLPIMDRQQNSSFCDLSHLSCNLIDKLSNSTVMNIIPVQTETEAIAMVRSGELWGYFNFPYNYSKHFETYMLQKVFSNNATLEGSRVILRLDMSAYLGASMAIQAAFNAYFDFLESTATSCGVDPREVSLPLFYRAPIFDKSGLSNPTYQDYVFPVTLITVIFEVPLLVTSILLIGDRKQGTTDRARIAGLEFMEIMASHVITQGSVIICQSAICTIIMFLGYNFVIKGSPVLYFFILILTGLCGTSIGIFIGVFLAEEIEALLVIIFIGFILLSVEGALWPVEGIVQSGRFLVRYFAPTTLIIESLRSEIYRGVGLLHSLVWPGIVVIATWTVIVFLLSIIVVELKNK